MPDVLVTTSTARQRVRAEITREIADEARRQLASDGATSLSLRNVARELGMVSSAVYRYFPSRDDLLTALIIDAYDSIGRAVEETERKVARRNLRGRWLAACRTVRTWAIDHRHEYALIHGSPVPGYSAPTDTIGPATRVQRVLLGILDDRGALEDSTVDPRPVPRSVRQDLDRIRDVLASEVSDADLLAGMAAWTELYGTVSFEVFGQLNNVVSEPARYFEWQMQRCADRLRL